MTGDTASLENWANVAVVFDIEHILRVTQPSFVLDVPLLTGLIALFVGQKRVRFGQVENLVIGPSRVGVLKKRRLLAMGVAAAAVVADFAPGIS